MRSTMKNGPSQKNGSSMESSQPRDTQTILLPQTLTFTSHISRVELECTGPSSPLPRYRKILPTPPCPPPIRKPSKVSCASQPPTSSKPHVLMQLLHNFSEPQTSELHDLPSHSLHQVAILEYEVPIQSSDLAILTGFRSLSNQVNPIPTCPLGEACNSGLIFWWWKFCLVFLPEFFFGLNFRPVTSWYFSLQFRELSCGIHVRSSKFGDISPPHVAYV